MKPAMSALHRRTLRRGPRLALAIALAAVCAGCASSSPPVRFHTLLPETLPQPLAAAPASSLLSAPRTRQAESAPQGGQGNLGAARRFLESSFVLDPVKVPASVDQPQWLVRRPDQSLALLEQDRWASPLADELHAALAERLRLRFGLQQARSAAERQAAALRIGVSLSRFESIPGREVLIEATWTVTPKHGTATRCNVTIQQPVGDGIEALAGGHRRAVARLGDAIGEQLLAWQRAGVMRCVAPPP